MIIEVLFVPFGNGDVHDSILLFLLGSKGPADPKVLRLSREGSLVGGLVEAGVASNDQGRVHKFVRKNYVDNGLKTNAAAALGATAVPQKDGGRQEASVIQVGRNVIRSQHSLVAVLLEPVQGNNGIIEKEETITIVGGESVSATRLKEFAAE